MSDFGRDAVQDMLPDLVHGRLSAADAAAVKRAVAADPALAAELELLRSVRAAQPPLPVIDVARIVAALPAPPAAAVAPAVDDLAVRRAAKQPWISRRFARAAALLVVVGGGTMVSVWEGRGTASAPAAPGVMAESVTAGRVAPELGLGTSTDELSVEQLRALEADIRALDGVPSAEPDATAELMPAEGA